VIQAHEEERVWEAPDGTKLFYRIWRAPSRRGALLLVHGLGSNSTRWMEFAGQTTLREHWDLIAPDLRGHGRSPSRRPSGMQQWASDLAGILDAPGHPRAIVVGHSLGALVALAFARRYPDRTRGLVLIEPSFPQAFGRRGRVLRRCRPLLILAAGVVRALNALGLRRRILPYRDLRALDERARALLGAGKQKEMVRLYGSVWRDLRFNHTANYLDDFIAQVGPVPPLEEIQASVLSLISRDSPFTASAQTENVLASLPHNRTVRLPATHWILTETPQEARRVIEEWIRSV
jgi:esterase